MTNSNPVSSDISISDFIPNTGMNSKVYKNQFMTISKNTTGNVEDIGDEKEVEQVSSQKNKFM